MENETNPLVAARRFRREAIIWLEHGNASLALRAMGNAHAAMADHYSAMAAKCRQARKDETLASAI
jgi:hypothetical protein